jgi:hypothetical protein
VEPEHAPAHPAKLEPLVGTGVSVTTAPELKLAVHVVPQLMPAGLEVSVPVPVPSRATVSAKVPGATGAAVKVALMLVVALIVTVQFTVAAHPPPDQPANVEPLAGVGINVTAVPALNVAVHVEPQLMPAGLDATVPVPVPPSVTFSAKLNGAALNVAVTVLAALITTTHEGAELPHDPPQPAKVDPADGVAVSVTEAPDAKYATQVEPQLSPEGVLVTLPVPVPPRVTVRSMAVPLMEPRRASSAVGAFARSLETTRRPVRVPGAVGLNVTNTPQDTCVAMGALTGQSVV